MYVHYSQVDNHIAAIKKKNKYLYSFKMAAK